MRAQKQKLALGLTAFLSPPRLISINAAPAAILPSYHDPIFTGLPPWIGAIASSQREVENTGPFADCTNPSQVGASVMIRVLISFPKNISPEEVERAEDPEQSQSGSYKNICSQHDSQGR